ncbi:MAG: bifunctional folylpolyglutamate synthase/dihydrofolate synthase [Brevinematia bacterium]
MTLLEGISYLYSLTDLERSRDFSLMKEGFVNVEKALKLFNLDYNSKPIIHVAGTKGKGSVSLITSYILSKFHNKKVGVFTSPHLVSITERISIFDRGFKKDISESDFIRILNDVRKVKEENNLNLTTFDFLTVMAMIYFFKINVDVIVLEVGLGGRLDSTNFCLPRVAVITLIDYDHTNVLGKTLKKIAYEKAGIIKSNIPVVVSKQNKEVKELIKRIAESKNSKCFFIDEKYKIDNVRFKDFNTFAEVVNLNTNEVIKLRTSLIGKHFIENILTSFEATSFIVNDSSILDIDFIIPGRFEILKKNPLIVFDVAHTPKSIKYSVSTFKKIFKGDFDIIISLMKDKEIEKISKVLYSSNVSNVYVKPLPENDGSQKLYENLKSLGLNVSFLDKIEVKNNMLILGSFRIYEEVKYLKS